jgi:hypothetical protein
MRAETDNAAGSTAAAKTPTRQELQHPVDLAAEVARVLAAMSFEERVRAYRSRAFSPHELSVAAAWFADEMPMLNGEFEWIAINLE